MSRISKSSHSRLSISSRLRSATRLLTCTLLFPTTVHCSEEKVISILTSQKSSPDLDKDEGSMHSSSAFTYPPPAYSLSTPVEADPSKLFPHIDEETMTAILNHDFPAAELYKLDTRRIQESSWHIVDLNDSLVSFRSVPSAREIYQNLDALMIPLNTYFSILSVHALSNGQPITVPHYFFKYSSHLIKIAAQYEWSAVLLYHFAFFARRCNEMLHGDYSGWAKIDVDLMEEILVQHRKPIPRKM
ncbi:unnamed protein product [Somion occarium]|uniref:Uncharacterized protein n=1 Tax=Somion occarium TaxID=3059160 RepID=A0ABP1D0X7_9APHY